MKKEEIFPPDDNDLTQKCYILLARRLNCEEKEVDAAFRSVGIVLYLEPQHLDLVKRETHDLNEAARHARNLAKSLMRLTRDEDKAIWFAGAVSVPQIEHLAAVLEGEAKSLEDTRIGIDRKGGRNPAAHAVAEGVRRLFRRLRREITFGSSPSGDPSTDFARTVQLALGEFQILADWRRPAQAAFEKQLQIQGRLIRCSANRLRRQPNAK